MPQLPSVSELIVSSQEKVPGEPIVQKNASPTSPRVHNTQYFQYKRFDRASSDGGSIDIVKPINNQATNDYLNFNYNHLQNGQQRASVSSSIDPLSRNPSMSHGISFKHSPMMAYPPQQPMMVPNSSYFPSSTMQQQPPVVPMGSNGMIPVGASPMMYTPTEPYRPQYYQSQNKHQVSPAVSTMKDPALISPRFNFPVYQEIPYFYQPPHHLPYTDADNILSKHRIVKKRTRTGCLTCRKRRIKCDEKKPHCFNCERSKKVCLGYEDLSSLKSKKKRTEEKEKEVPKSPKSPKASNVSSAQETSPTSDSNDTSA